MFAKIFHFTLKNWSEKFANRVAGVQSFDKDYKQKTYVVLLPWPSCL